MKGDVESILRFGHNLKIFKKYLFKKFSQEVVTLHLLTITLRRILNPPGFFYTIWKLGICQIDNKTKGKRYKDFINSILFINLSLLRFFNKCNFEGNVRSQKQINRSKLLGGVAALVC
jgi:hypothetical protein